MSNRLYGLDVIRTLCALYVVFYHYFFRSVNMGDYNSGMYDPNNLFSYGWIGVQFFFTISGFVIYYSCTNIDYKKFLKSRILRLYPAYWISISLTLIFMFYFDPSWWVVDFWGILINITMLQTFVGIKNVDGAYWTLAYELIFYFWMAVCIYFNRITLIKILLASSAAIYCVSTFFGFYNSLGIISKIFLLQYSAYFLIGIFLFEYSNKIKINFFAVLICSVGILIELNLKTSNISQRSGGSLLPIVSWAHYLTFIIFFFLITKFNTISEKLKQPFIIIGSLSYPLYLIHQNIGYILIPLFMEYFSSSVSIYLSTIIVIGFSLIIAMYLEPAVRHSMKYRFFSEKGTKYE